MKGNQALYFYSSPEEVRNATVYRDLTAHVEGALLLTVSVVGGVGNLLILCAPLLCSRYRTTSCAFLSHHCLLDSVKSLFCVPFACALLLDMDIPCCNALGATYVFLMTLTAYNLLALHINEEYQLTNRQGYIPGQPDGYRLDHVDKKNSFWCVSFGIFMIWFTTVLLHLGVAFLPSSAEFNYDIGNCVFNYGTPKNYVIHILWTMLVSGALLIAVVCFTMFFCKLRTHMHREKWTLLHTSISQDLKLRGDVSREVRGPEGPVQRRPGADQPSLLPPDTEELHYEFAEGVDQTATRQIKLCLRRVLVMLLMVLSFLLFWYPLFILTLLDVHYTRPPQTYRVVMILAWSHPITTPVFCAVIYFDMLSMKTLTRSVYSAAIPLKDSSSFSSSQREDARHDPPHPHRHRMYDLGFTNQNFYGSHRGSPDNRREDGSDEGGPRGVGGEGGGGGGSATGHGDQDSSVYVTLPLRSVREGQEEEEEEMEGGCHSCSVPDSYQTLIIPSPFALHLSPREVVKDGHGVGNTPVVQPQQLDTRERSWNSSLEVQGEESEIISPVTGEIKGRYDV